ncbi:sulfite exporter TauE/SafE family protein [Elioraea sp.]|uniref:sulfite exporter TauE/SafE family protein n=1 Tax=Elioraea sp. TaxID=2185103 RepID=UPI003F71A8CF
MHDPLWLAGLAAATAVTGLIAGLLAGLFGVGGGIVIVPVLSYVLPLLGIDPAVQQKLAVSTSLATIIPTSIVSARKHYAKGAIDVPLLRGLVPSLLAGTVIGALLIVVLRGEALTLVFAVVALLVALNLGLTGADWRIRDRFPEGAPRHAIGAAMGGVSAVMGIGGGTVGVPIMSMFGTPIRRAVATASAFGIVISIPATIIAIIGGWGEARMPPYSVGYVNLIGFALIAVGSILAAPWGAHLAHTIPPLLLKRLFALFLALTSLRMFWRTLG